MANTINIASPEGASSAQIPVVCLGLPLYNQTQHLPEALNSLLAQTYRNFKLIVCDDSTEPGSGEIVKSFAVRDQRIIYYKNENRKGLVDNWRNCFDLAGNADYFAWVSDHDVWHPKWLESLIHILNTRANVLLVYPKTAKIDEHGNRLNKKSKSNFSSLGLSETQRVQTLCKRAKGFGNMVYGLFRVEALRRAGVFRRVIWPDVILLLELSLQGDIHHVDEELWYRRITASFRIERQKNSLFARKPWYITLPWPIVNASVLFWNTAIRPDFKAWRNRKLGLKLAIMYLQRWWRKFGSDSRIGSYRQWRKRREQKKRHLRNGKYTAL
jgi:glycosyltransferase involved in cell wall biosynthesis